MSRVVHFEIHAEDPERAIKFYTATLDWEFNKLPFSEEYWLIKTGPDDQPGIDGGMIKRRGKIDGQAVIAYVCTVKVASVDAAVARATTNGGVNVVPKMAIPGVGYLAYCKDTEGNIFGLMNDDPRAT